MTQILFVLTGAGAPEKLSRYSAGLALAAMTAKLFHPDVPVVCLGDEYGERLLGASSSRVADFVDRFIPCPDATGGPVHRSRVIKTTLRQRVRGPFVFLDTDTALIGDIQPLLACDSPVGLTLDSWFPEAVGEFPKWCCGVYRELGWSYPTPSYYNSGVMFADESHDSYALFKEWHERYSRSVALGINLDQPSFNSAVQQLGTRIRVYPEEYNFFCGQTPKPIPSSARLLHVCSSLQATRIPAYEEAIATLQNGGEVDASELVANLKGTGTQAFRKWHLPWNLHRRIREFAQRRLFKMKLDSAERY